jgi:nucleoporin POM152
LNPEHVPLCLNSKNPSVSLPIRVNQTDPISIELLRFDLDTGVNETITIPSKQLKQMKRQAEKLKTHTDRSTYSEVHFTVRKTGIYRLKRVLDESNLEVHVQGSDTLVVS